MKGLGYFLGATFGAALLFFVISFIFFRPRKVTEIEINKYITNSNNILIETVPYVGGILAHDDKRLGRDLISKLTYFSNKNMSYYKADTYTYFSKELNKYIRTYNINRIGSNMTSTILDFGKKDKDKSQIPDMYFIITKLKMQILLMVQWINLYLFCIFVVQNQSFVP